MLVTCPVHPLEMILKVSLGCVLLPEFSFYLTQVIEPRHCIGNKLLE